jgi:hypothetical protein
VIIILSLDAPKSIRETEKNPTNPLFRAKKPQKTQKSQKTQKKTKKPKKTHWAGFFFFKPGFFPTLCDIVGKFAMSPM